MVQRKDSKIIRTKFNIIYNALWTIEWAIKIDFESYQAFMDFEKEAGDACIMA